MGAFVLSGFGDDGVNGIYFENGSHDGFPFYQNAAKTYQVIYKLENGPYAYSPAYWIEERNVTNGSIPFYGTKYVAYTSDVYTATWIALQDITSGELTVGVVEDISSESSSSSSIDSSSSTSSSSSEDYSESSSSSEDYSESSSSSV
jgi:hypothetical protein